MDVQGGDRDGFAWWGLEDGSVGVSATKQNLGRQIGTMRAEEYDQFLLGSPCDFEK